MNKKEMIAQIAEKTGQTPKEVNITLDSFFELVATALEAGDNVRLVGFGTFTSKTRAARQGRNLRTGEIIEIPAATLPVFKAGKKLKNRANKG